ncbi:MULTISPECIES: DUF3817 domain-containing protein [Gordonia]|uniref:DUF3817 domain-containing protein n=1 Tax=Gordonia TaxID=2053 RepID=UPI00034C47B1|nr:MULTISPECIES: DUF3817 domain-containing protein [Gordonia]KJR10121.1 hypothetical protein UG54_02210 [Gordonia sihwensis]KXT55877.1 hypothetical protein Y710_16770 [Gordonia sp. QH-12]KXT55894.1 hypothetical protein Y710_16875 [Gordonia sp. QH-12]WFN94112.1 DUF3817 domain-containing protein [Gordonia sihwensis]
MTESAKTADDAPDGTVTATIPQIRSALLRYRVLAWVTGVWLLALCAEMIAKFGFGVEGFGWVGVAHGWIYFIYLICTVDLSIKVRWPLPKLVATAIAGTIPFLSFWFEHIRTRDVKEQFKLDQ